MPVPTDATLDELVTEGLKLAGRLNPSTTLLTRAKTEWMKTLKNEFWRILNEPKLLQVTSHGILPAGQVRFSNPEDYSEDLKITLLDGATGIAQAGSINSITFAADANFTEAGILGQGVLVTSGTGVGSFSHISSFNAATQQAGVTPNFPVGPAISSGYMVVNKEYELTDKPMFVYERLKEISRGIPKYYFPYGDEDFAEFILQRPLDKTYGARLRYYADVSKIDTDSTWMRTIYRKWRAAWLQGIKWLDRAQNLHTDAQNEYALFRQMVAEMNRKAYGNNVKNTEQYVTDFR